MKDKDQLKEMNKKMEESINDGNKKLEIIEKAEKAAEEKEAKEKEAKKDTEKQTEKDITEESTIEEKLKKVAI